MDAKADGLTRSSSSDRLAEAPKFSSVLEATLSEVLPTDDPLDSVNFDPIDYINQQFPDESSLHGGKLDTFLLHLKRRAANLSETITKDVRQHSCRRTETQEAIEAATTNTQMLFGKIASIKAKAAQSEVMVQQMCRDIRLLDYAKKNLSSAIWALRNLHMLVSALGQLRRTASNQDYKRVASLLKAIGDLLKLFEPHKGVPKLQTLRATVDDIKRDIKHQITQDFTHAVPTPLVGVEGFHEKLHNACLVVDELDPVVKEDLLKWFMRSQLEPYQVMFALGKEGGSLDQTERRFAWLRRLFRTFDEHFATIFPKAWEVPANLSREFCAITRRQLTDILQAQGVRQDVPSLVKTLQKTIEFEKELDVRFRNMSVAETLKAAQDDPGASTYAAAEAIKDKYRRKAEQEKLDIRAAAEAHDSGRNIFTGEAKAGGAQADGGDKDKAESKLTFKFARMISDCLMPYMGGYIDLERKQLMELLERSAGEEKWYPDDKAANTEKSHLETCDNLFVYLKKSMNYCSKLITGQLFYNVVNEYTRALSNFAVMLDRRIPRLNDSSAALTVQDMQALCLIVNTGEYCNEALPSVQESIQKLTEQPYRDQVDLSPLQEEFGVLINKAVAAMVASITIKLSKCLAVMGRTNWATLDSVGDQSDYVTSVHQVLVEQMPSVAAMLSPAYHKYICSTLAGQFIPRFVDAIFKSKRVSDMGAQQLALDAHAIKDILLNLPAIASKKSATPRRAAKDYIKFVGKEMGHAEALLKTLISPPERLVATFRALLPKSGAENLVQIMNLRGIRKSDQQALFDLFNAAAKPEDRVSPQLEAKFNISKLLNKLS
jgi:hypothetical protein